MSKIINFFEHDFDVSLNEYLGKLLNSQYVLSINEKKLKLIYTRSRGWNPCGDQSGMVISTYLGYLLSCKYFQNLRNIIGPI